MSKIGDKLGPDKRKEGESYKDYRIRRIEEQRLLKNYLRGDLTWPSGGAMTEAILLMQIRDPHSDMNLQIANQVIQASRGTYVKKKHGIITSGRRAV